MVDDFISPASTMKLRVPVRGRAKNSTRKPRGGSLCVRPTPSFMPSPPARGTPSSARRRKMRTDEKITVQNPSETLRFAARVPYPFSCARRRLPPHHRPATPRWRIFFRWQNPTTNPRGTTAPSTDCRARTRPPFHSHHRRPYPNAHYRTIRSSCINAFHRAPEPHHSQSTQTQA